MKDNLHPEYTDAVPVSCACGATFTTGSTMSEIRTELCSSCHPFYTGKQKLVDTARRVEKFETRASTVKSMAGTRGKKKVRRAVRATTKRTKAAKEDK